MKDKYSKESTQLRDFQKEGVKFLLKRPRSILGDAVGLGKTLQFLTAFAIYKSKFEGAKLIIVTNKSLIKQTEMQVGRFFEGFRVKSLEDMTPKKRWEAYGDFFGGDFDILIWGYGSLRNDLNPDQKVVVKVKSVNSEPLEVKSRYGVFKVNSKQELSYTLMGGKIKRPSFNATYTLDVGGERFTVYLEKKPYYTTLEMSSPLRKSEIAYSSVFMKEMENFRPKEKGLVLVLDEALSVKSPKSAAHKSVRMLCESCSKVVAVTATISKGGLEEPYNILKCLGIKVVENWEVFSKRFLIYNLSHI
ncbi:MAG: DEAD/DEAH box helicase family protein, partial [Sulfurovaceae bacterium]|nr:DEAD/DEAH box helicase family protein [Sulfurovaceae bacterium]